MPDPLDDILADIHGGGAATAAADPLDGILADLGTGADPSTALATQRQEAQRGNVAAYGQEQATLAANAAKVDAQIRDQHLPTSGPVQADERGFGARLWDSITGVPAAVDAGLESSAARLSRGVANVPGLRTVAEGIDPGMQAELQREAADRERIAGMTPGADVVSTGADLVPWFMGPAGIGLAAAAGGGNRRRDVLDAGGGEGKALAAGAAQGAIDALLPKAVERVGGPIIDRLGKPLLDQLGEAPAGVAKALANDAGVGSGLSAGSAAVSAATGDTERAKQELAAMGTQALLGAGIGAGVHGLRAVPEHIAASREQKAYEQGLADASDRAARALSDPAQAQEAVVDPRQPGATVPTNDPAAGPAPRQVDITPRAELIAQEEQARQQASAAVAADQARRAQQQAVEGDLAVPPAHEVAAAEAEQRRAAIESSRAEQERQLRQMAVEDDLGPRPVPDPIAAEDSPQVPPRAAPPEPGDQTGRAAQTPAGASPEAATIEKARHLAARSARAEIEASHREAMDSIIAKRKAGELGKAQAGGLKNAADRAREARYGEAMDAIGKDQPPPAGRPIAEMIGLHEAAPPAAERTPAPIEHAAPSSEGQTSRFRELVDTLTPEERALVKDDIATVGDHPQDPYSAFQGIRQTLEMAKGLAERRAKKAAAAGLSPAAAEPSPAAAAEPAFRTHDVVEYRPPNGRLQMGTVLAQDHLGVQLRMRDGTTRNLSASSFERLRVLKRAKAADAPANPAPAAAPNDGTPFSPPRETRTTKEPSHGQDPSPIPQEAGQGLTSRGGRRSGDQADGAELRQAHAPGEEPSGGDRTPADGSPEGQTEALGDGEQGSPERIPGENGRAQRKLEGGGFVTKAQAEEQRQAPKVDPHAETERIVRKPRVDDSVQGTVQRVLDRSGSSAGRLPEAPLPGGDPARKLPDIIKDVGDWLGAQVHRGPTPTGVGGYYDPKSAAIVVRKAGDLDTAAHEIAHWTDDAYGILADHQSQSYANGLDPQTEARVSTFDGELQHFWPHGSSPRRGMNAAQAQNYRRAEGVAEYLRAWMLNPDAAERAAPLFTRHVQTVLPEAVRGKLRDFGDEVRRWAGLPADVRSQANIRDLADTGPSALQNFVKALKDSFGKGDTFRTTALDRTSFEMLDALAPAMKAVEFAKREQEQRGVGRPLPENDPETLMRLLGGINDKMQDISDHGMVQARWIKDGEIQRGKDVHGGLDWLTGWVDNRTKETVNHDLDDLSQYMVNQRVVEQANHLDREVAESVQGRAKVIGENYAAERDALDLLEQRRRDQIERHRERTGRVVEAVDEVQQRAGKDVAKTDADLGRVADLSAEGRKAAQDRLSAAREQLAKRGDGVAKQLVEVIDRVDRAGRGISTELVKEVQRLRKAAFDRYQGRMTLLASGAERLRRAANATKSRMSGTGGGIFSDHAQAKEALARVAADPVRRARLEEGAKRYRAWSDSVLRYAVEKGRLSEEAYQAIASRNEYYVAMHRAAEAGGFEGMTPTAIRRIGRAANPIKKWTGSTKFIDNPYANLLDQTARVVQEADRNEALRSFVDLLQVPARGMHDGDQPALASIGQKVIEGGETTVPVYRNGEVEHWHIQDDLLRQSLKGFGGSQEYNWIAHGFMIPAKVLRAGVVYSPMFAVRNRMRDTVHRLWISDVPSDLGGWARRIREQVPGLTGQTETDRTLAKLAGGAFAGHYMGGKSQWQSEIRSRAESLSKDRNAFVVGLGKAGGAYGHWLHNSELIGRVDEFRAAFREAKRQGMDDYNASLTAGSQARNLIDFASAGRSIRHLNQFVPFLNATIQGGRATARAARNHPWRMAGRLVMGPISASIASYAWAAMQGKDVADEYRNLPAWRRDLFWNVKLSPGTWLAIPKPYEAGVLATGAERLVDATMRVHGGESVGSAMSGAFSGYTGSLAKALLPIDGEQFIGPLKTEIEIAMNRSLFTGSDIIPGYQSKLPVDQRDTSTASRLGKVGQAITGADARVIDHLIRGHFGNLGGLAMSASDLGRPDKPMGASDTLKSTTGILRSGEGRHQVDVEQFVAQEEREGRPAGKPIATIHGMAKDYWQARTASEREAIAKAMRDYADGVDPLMAFDRASGAANQFQAQLHRLDGPARESFIAANEGLVRRAKAIDRAASAVQAAKRRGGDPTAVRALAKRLLAGINQEFPAMASGEP